MNKILFALFLITLIDLTSCKEDDALNLQTVLTTGKWDRVLATLNPPVTVGPLVISELDQLEEICDKDNLRTFGPNNFTYELAGPTKCQTNDLDTLDVSLYNLNVLDSTLAAIFFSGNVTFKITSFSNSEINLKVLNPSAVDPLIPASTNMLLRYKKI